MSDDLKLSNTQLLAEAWRDWSGEDATQPFTKWELFTVGFVRESIVRADANRIAELEAERDNWKRKYGDANVWGLQNCAAWKDRAEQAEAECERMRGFLRQHAVSHDPTVRPMWSTCNICEASWGGEDEESHGPGCPFYAAAIGEKP